MFLNLNPNPNLNLLSSSPPARDKIQVNHKMKPIVTSGAGLNSSKVGTPRCGVRTAQRAVPTIEMKNLVVRLVTSRLARLLPIAASLLSFLAAPAPAGAQTNLPPEIRTPKPPAVPRINGPAIFGVRPGSPLLYRIPATGDRPMQFSIQTFASAQSPSPAAAALPATLHLDSQTGEMTGSLTTPGEVRLLLRAKNALGSAEKEFKIVAGDTIALTPPMGWNSWNCWGSQVDARQSPAQRPRPGRFRPCQSRLELHQH